MNSLFQTDKQRVQLYMAENAEWLKTIIAQANEIPVLKKMLNDGNVDKGNGKEGIEKELFNKELSLQEEEMTKLNSTLCQQQERLQTSTAREYPYHMDSLWSQDLLRERIMEVEKKYIKLKCSFVKFLASAI
jgi:hypothetical protein